MEAEQIISTIIFFVLAVGASLLISFILSKINWRLVFLLPITLTVFSAFGTLFIFSGEAGWGILILAGLWVILLMVTAVSWITALVIFFRQRSRRKS